ncbi:hypothetical protein AAE478_006828 [Parahypoxylon ruwenzoriense]
MASSQAGPDPLGRDISLSLQTLSDWAIPYVKVAGIVMILAYGFPASPVPAQGWPAWSANTTIPAPQPGQLGVPYHPFLLIAVLAYFSGILKLPDFSSTPEAAAIPSSDSNPNPAASLAAPLLAWETLKEKLGIHIKIAFFVFLISFFPILHNFPLPLQPWFYCFLFAIVSVVGFFAPTSKFHGPLRFGYLEYGPHLYKVYALLSRWWFHTVLFLYFFPYIFPLATPIFYLISPFSPSLYILIPTISLSILVVSVTGYVHTYRTYTAQVAEITAQSTAAASDATVAASHSQTLVRSARESEKQLLEVVAVTRRDAALAQSIRMTDFFDCTANAWASLGRVTASAKGAANRVDNLTEQVITLEDAEKPDEEEGGRTEELVTYLKEETERAAEEAKALVAQLKAAQEIVESSQRAREQDVQGREKVLANAREAAREARVMREALIGLEEGLYTATEGAEKVKGITEKAKVAAVDGEMKKARELVAEAKKAVEGVIEEKKKLGDAVENARKILFELLQSV